MIRLKLRQKELVTILLKADSYITLNELALVQNVSKKTIQRDIVEINYILKSYDCVISVEKGKGICLIGSGLNLNRFLLDIRTNNENNEINKRRKDILLDFLYYSPNLISIAELSDKYCVSQSSIVYDIKSIEQEVSKEGFVFEKSKKGTKIIADEKSIRTKINELLNENFYDNEECINIPENEIEFLKNKFSNEEIIAVKEMISDIEQKLNYKIGDPYYINIFTHTLIAIERIDHTLPNNDFADINIHVFKIVNDAVTDLEKKLDVSFPINEIKYLYAHVISSGIVNHDVERELCVETDTHYTVCEEFSELLKKESSIDLNDDKYLKNYLYFHLLSLINRVRYKILVKCPLVKQVKKENEELFEIIRNILNRVFYDNEIEGTLADDEICYIVLYLLAVKENVSNKKHLNVLLVCSTGIGTSHLVKRKIDNTFKDWQVIDMVSSKKLEQLSLVGVDLILSTIRIDESKLSQKRPVIYISPLFNEKDIQLINKIILEKDVMK